MFEEKLNVRTRSIPTAAAIMVIGGFTPPEAEGALQQFLRAKAQLDRMVEEDAA